MRLEIPDRVFGGENECVFTFKSLQQILNNQSPKLVEQFKGIATFVFQDDNVELDLGEMLAKMKEAYNAFFKYTNSDYECTQIAFCLPHGPLVFIKKLPKNIFENPSK